MSLGAVTAFAVVGVVSASACALCRNGGDPRDCLDALKTDRSGDLRIEAAIDKYQTSSLDAPPLTIATRAADLPAPARRPVVAVMTPVAAHVTTAPAPVQTHAVDGALGALAVAGGIFCWRTRRAEA